MREMAHFWRTFGALFENPPPIKTDNNEPGKHRERPTERPARIIGTRPERHRRQISNFCLKTAIK